MTELTKKIGLLMAGTESLTEFLVLGLFSSVFRFGLILPTPTGSSYSEEILANEVHWSHKHGH